jgi:transposase
VQIKEKYGTIRIYWTRAPVRVRQAGQSRKIDLAEARVRFAQPGPEGESDEAMTSRQRRPVHAYVVEQTSHHWSRELQALGHTVRLLMSPAYVKSYVHRGKNEAADAEAICEAVARPTMRFVGVMNRSPPILRGFGFRSNEHGFNC